MTCFDARGTLDELKAAYKRLAMLHRPDVGDEAVMKEVNAGRDAAFPVLKRERDARAEGPESRVRATAEALGEFRGIVEAPLRLGGLDAGLCGLWLWIGGETCRHRKALNLAFRASRTGTWASLALAKMVLTAVRERKVLSAPCRWGTRSSLAALPTR